MEQGTGADSSFGIHLTSQVGQASEVSSEAVTARDDLASFTRCRAASRGSGFRCMVPHICPHLADVGLSAENPHLLTAADVGHRLTMDDTGY